MSKTIANEAAKAKPVAKKKVTKKKVVKKQVARKTVSKKKVVKKQVAKKTASKKQVVKKQVAKKAVAKKKVANKPVARKKAASSATTRVVSDRDRYLMIEERAYYLAEARNFHPGNEHDDWLEAEHFVDNKLGRK